MPDDINRHFNNIYERLARLEKLVPFDPPFAHFSWWGPLQLTQSGKFPVRFDCYVSTIHARLTVAGTTDTLFKIRFTDTDLPLFANVFTIPAGDTYLLVEGYEELSPFLRLDLTDPSLSDYITCEVSAVGTGAETIEVDVGFWTPS